MNSAVSGLGADRSQFARSCGCEVGARGAFGPAAVGGAVLFVGRRRLLGRTWLIGGGICWVAAAPLGEEVGCWLAPVDCVPGWAACGLGLWLALAGVETGGVFSDEGDERPSDGVRIFCEGRGRL